MQRRQTLEVFSPKDSLSLKFQTSAGPGEDDGHLMLPKEGFTRNSQSELKGMTSVGPPIATSSGKNLNDPLEELSPVIHRTKTLTKSKNRKLDGLEHKPPINPIVGGAKNLRVSKNSNVCREDSSLSHAKADDQSRSLKNQSRLTTNSQSKSHKVEKKAKS